MTLPAGAVVPAFPGARRVADRLAFAVVLAFLALLLMLVGTACYCWASPGVVRLGRYGVMGPNARIRTTMRFNSLMIGQKLYSNVTMYLFPGRVSGRELYSLAGFRLLEME